MTVPELTVGSPPDRGYRHEALIYANEAEFVRATLAFIDEGLSNGEPMLVVLDEEKIDALRTDLGLDAELVTFADMAEVGSNPARIIGVWHTFLTEHDGFGPMRGIGQQVYGQRTAEELAECQLHEALLNIAFADADLWLLCPYNLGSLAEDDVARVLRTHPFIADGTVRRVSGQYRPPDLAAMFAAPLEDAPSHAVQFEFALRDLAELRQIVMTQAVAMRFHAAQVDEVVTAVNEVATNAVEHGQGRRILRIWPQADVLHFEITDQGRFNAPLAGRIPPSAKRTDGRGLWIANQLCDLLQIRTAAAGTIVRGQIHRVGTA